MLILAAIFISLLQTGSPQGMSLEFLVRMFSGQKRRRWSFSVSFSTNVLLDHTKTEGPTVPFPLPTTPFDLYTQNLTVVDMTPRSISLRWSCRNHHLHDKYELTLKPLKAT